MSDKSGSVLAKAVHSAAARLGLLEGQLAIVLGLSVDSVSSLGRGYQLIPTSKEAELGLLMLRLFQALDAIMGGAENKARLWMRAHNVHLAGVPAERIQTGEGLLDVVRYLEGVGGGA